MPPRSSSTAFRIAGREDDKIDGAADRALVCHPHNVYVSAPPQAPGMPEHTAGPRPRHLPKASPRFQPFPVCFIAGSTLPISHFASVHVTASLRFRFPRSLVGFCWLRRLHAPCVLLSHHHPPPIPSSSSPTKAKGQFLVSSPSTCARSSRSQPPKTHE